MAEEANEDVQPVEETTEESSPETNQPEQEPNVSEDVQTQESSEGSVEEKSPRVPLKRLKKVTDQNRELKAALAQARKELGSRNAEPLQQSQSQGEEDNLIDPAIEAKLGDIIEARVQKSIGGLSDYVAQQRENEMINDARDKYPEFDQYAGEVSEILREMPELGSTAKPYETAYMIARGLTVSEAAKAAKAQGQAEAYKSIDQKVASRSSAPVPKKEAGQSDLLAKFKSGQLSSDQVKANWSKIQQEMAQ